MKLFKEKLMEIEKLNVPGDSPFLLAVGPLYFVVHPNVTADLILLHRFVLINSVN